MDNTGRFGIGTSFIQPLDEPGQVASLTTVSPPPTPIYDATTPGDPFLNDPTTSPIVAISPPQTNYTVPKPGTIGPSLVPVVSSQPNNFSNKSTSNGNTKNKISSGGSSAANRYCEICDISVTSDQQMETHKNGQKHQKKCKQLGICCFFYK